MSLSGGADYTEGPAIWMEGRYHVRLSMADPEAEGCTDWLLGLGYEVFDTFVWATGPDGVELVDGDYEVTTPPVNDRLHPTGWFPPDCGRWTVRFTPVGS